MSGLIDAGFGGAAFPGTAEATVTGAWPSEIMTPRLRLVPGSADLVRAELEDRERFASLLASEVPGDWPPPLNDENSIRYSLDKLTADETAVGWWCWYIVLCRTHHERDILIGVGGFKGRPDSKGGVEVGYSIVPEYQHQGFGTEAIRALTNWAFTTAKVKTVYAETLPELTPSIRVLEKLGFKLIGKGSEPGVIRYAFKRPSDQPAKAQAAANPALEVVQKIYAAFARHDLGDILELLDDEVVWLYPRPRDIPWGGEWNGREDVGRFFATLAAHAQMVTFEPRLFFADGANVAVFGRQVFQMKATGRKANADWSHHWVVQNGKVTYYQGYTDTGAIIEALRSDKSEKKRK